MKGSNWEVVHFTGEMEGMVVIWANLAAKSQPIPRLRMGAKGGERDQPVNRFGNGEQDHDQHSDHPLTDVSYIVL